MENPADIDDVRGSFERPLTSDEERVVPNWIDRAWRKLQSEVPGIPARVDLPDTDPNYLDVDSVTDVIVAMVERKLRNPSGMRTFDLDGDGGTVDSALSSGQIYVSDEERAQLEARPPSSSTNAIFGLPLGGNR